MLKNSTRLDIVFLCQEGKFGAAITTARLNRGGRRESPGHLSRTFDLAIAVSDMDGDFLSRGDVDSPDALWAWEGG